MFSAIAYLLFCAACTVLAFKRHPIWGFCFYAATIYVYPPSRWWGYMIPDLRWALLSAGVAILAIALHRGRLAAKPPWIANGPAIILTMYGAWMWAQSPWALDPAEHFDGATRFLKYLVTFWIVYRLTDTKETLRDILFCHAAGCALLGIFALTAGREGGRLDGVGGPGLDDANTLGMYLATGMITAFGLFMVCKGWRRWVSLGMMALIANGFVLANSRGAFLGVVGGMLVLLFCKARQHRRLFWSIALVGLVAFSVIVDKVFIERMFTIGDVVEESEDADMSARSRMEIYKAQLRMAADYPFGVGYRGTVVLSPYYLDRKWLSRGADGKDDPDAGRSSHNTLMTTLVEQGSLGLAMFICLLIWLLRSIFRIRSMAGSGTDPDVTTMAATYCGAIVVVIVAGSATDYLMAEVQFWLFAGLVSALRLGGAIGTNRAPVASPVLRPLPGAGQ